MNNNCSVKTQKEIIEVYFPTHWENREVHLREERDDEGKETGNYIVDDWLYYAPQHIGTIEKAPEALCSELGIFQLEKKNLMTGEKRVVLAVCKALVNEKYHKDGLVLGNKDFKPCRNNCHLLVFRTKIASAVSFKMVA